MDWRRAPPPTPESEHFTTYMVYTSLGKRLPGYRVEKLSSCFSSSSTLMPLVSVGTSVSRQASISGARPSRSIQHSPMRLQGMGCSRPRVPLRSEVGRITGSADGAEVRGSGAASRVDGGFEQHGVTVVNESHECLACGEIKVS